MPLEIAADKFLIRDDIAKRANEIVLFQVSNVALTQRNLRCTLDGGGNVLLSTVLPMKCVLINTMEDDKSVDFPIKKQFAVFSLQWAIEAHTSSLLVSYTDKVITDKML